MLLDILKTGRSWLCSYPLIGCDIANFLEIQNLRYVGDIAGFEAVRKPVVHSRYRRSQLKRIAFRFNQTFRQVIYIVHDNSYVY